VQVIEVSSLDWTSTDFAKSLQAMEPQRHSSDAKGPFKARALGSSPRRLTTSHNRQNFQVGLPESRASFRPCRKSEEAAREETKGLWADPHPVPPWEWRKQRK
jgi:hypothetical protein